MQIWRGSARWQTWSTGPGPLAIEVFCQFSNRFPVPSFAANELICSQTTLASHWPGNHGLASFWLENLQSLSQLIWSLTHATLLDIVRQLTIFYNYAIILTLGLVVRRINLGNASFCFNRKKSKLFCIQMFKELLKRLEKAAMRPWSVYIFDERFKIDPAIQSL